MNVIFNSLLKTTWKEPEGDLQVCLGKLYLRRRRVQPSTICWCGPLGRTLQSASILRANYGDGEGTKYKQPSTNKFKQKTKEVFSKNAKTKDEQFEKRQDYVKQSVDMVVEQFKNVE